MPEAPLRTEVPEVRFVLADQHGTARFYRINQNCVTCFPTAATQE
jgi:hypothetical protein